MIIIKSEGLEKMDYYSAFPFYMGYQGYGQWAQPGIVPEDRILEDLEYLRQMYPTYAKKYQNAISSVVDKMDYDGSFIYDQYPDKLTIQRMVESVMTIIRTNEDTMEEPPQAPIPDGSRTECHGLQWGGQGAHGTGSMAGKGTMDPGAGHSFDVL